MLTLTAVVYECGIKYVLEVTVLGTGTVR